MKSLLDLKTGVGLALVLVLGAWLTVEKIRHGDTKNDLRDVRIEYAQELAGRLQAEAVAHEWRVTAQKCDAEVRALRHIAKSEQDAWRRRMDDIKKRLSASADSIAATGSHYSAKDLRRDVTRWGI